MQSEILTVGHSTHEIERFLALLSGAGVEVVADVRRFPGSRRHPQFGAASLGASLREKGIGYEPFGEELGGRCSKKDVAAAGGDAPPDNSAWRNASFRAYADYLWTPAFAAGLERLEEVAQARRAAVMRAASTTRRSPR
jgi:uncharacterized protein (DUF488 family)